MGSKLRLFLLLFTLAALLAGCFGVGGFFGPPNPKTVDVAGSVRSLDTGLPIAGAAVQVGSKVTTTDTSGDWKLDDIPAFGIVLEWKVSAQHYHAADGRIPIDGDLLALHVKLASAGQGGTGVLSGRANYASNSSELRFGRAPGPAPMAQRSAPPTTAASSVIVEVMGELTDEVARRIATDAGASSYRINDRLGKLILELPEREVEITAMDLTFHPDVAFAEPNIIFTASLLPNDPLLVEQWHYYQANIPAAWSVTTGNPTIRVAVLDTGITAHPDLIDQIGPGWNSIDGNNDPTDGGEVGRAVASHGTHVAGTIGARTHNRMGVAGVAWDVEILPVKVLDDDGFGTLESVSEGIVWAVEYGADVINMSLGAPIGAGTLRQAVLYAAEHEVIMVAASGNEGLSVVSYPAAYPEVIAVGATNRLDQVTLYSNAGIGLDLVAPGGDATGLVISTNYNRSAAVPSYDYRGLGGTSMAAPHVSGVVALMLANGIPPGDVRQVLADTAIDLYGHIPGFEGWDWLSGHGLLNAHAAVVNANIAEALLFAVNDEGALISSVSQPQVDRTFRLENVGETESGYLIGWIDVNGDRSLDRGDYLAVTPFDLRDGEARRADLVFEIYDTFDLQSAPSGGVEGSVGRAAQVITTW